MTEPNVIIDSKRKCKGRRSSGTGGILKKKQHAKLAYLDYGLVAKIPLQVREGLICSVIHLLERNFTALALEFDSLMLMRRDDLITDLHNFTKVQ